MVADYSTRSIDDITTVAQEVMEAAYDLRAYELLGQFVDPADVDGSGDTRQDFYQAKLNAQPMAGYGQTTLDGVSTISNDSINAVSTEDHTDVKAYNLGHEFDWIATVFERYTCGDTGAYATVDEACQAAMNAHSSNPDLYETTAEFSSSDTGGFDVAHDIESSIATDAGLGNWTGEFATHLSDKVVGHISDISSNHVHLLGALQGATRLHWALVASARESIYSIGATTRDKLKAALGEQQDEHDDSEGWNAVIPVVEGLLAAAAVVVTVGTGGTAAPLTVSALVAVVGTIKAGIALDDAIEKSHVDLTGSSVDDLITSMNSAIAELDSVIQSEESSLAQAIEELNTDLSNLTSGASKKDWEAFRPDAADYPTSDDKTVYGPESDHYSEFHHEFG